MLKYVIKSQGNFNNSILSVISLSNLTHTESNLLPINPALLLFLLLTYSPKVMYANPSSDNTSRVAIIYESMLNTYKDSKLGFFVLSIEKKVIAQNDVANYYIDKFSLSTNTNFYHSTTFNSNFSEVIEKEVSTDVPLIEMGLHLYFSPLIIDKKLEGVLMQISETSQDLELSNTVPKPEEEINQHLLYLLNNLDAHVWLINPTGYIFWQNETIRKYGNFPADRMLVGDWVHMIHPDDLEIANKGLTDGLASLTTNYCEFRMKDGAGKYNLFQTAVKPIFNEDGQVQFWVGLNYNVEGFRRQIEQLTFELAQQRIESNNQLQSIKQLEKEIFQSQKMETIGSLAGGVAHDFNNLLMIISINAELIRFSDTHKQFDQEVQLILQSVKKGGNLASQLMTFSGKSPNLPSIINFEQSFKDLKILLQKSVTEHINFSISIADRIHPIFVDRSYFENALLNIVLNAKDALKDVQNARLKFSVQNYSTSTSSQFNLEEGDYVYFKIADNGAGMPQEVVDRIFEPFFTTKEVGKGTGLGLAMVYGFVKKANGDIFVESKEGSGTTFHLLLPASKEAFTVSNNEQEVEQNEIRYKGNILVVEDNPELRNSVILLLESIGFKCYSAFNTHSALLYLQKGMDIDLIFSDVIMPGEMNALDFYRELRQQGIEIPILYTSGYAENILVKDGEVIDDHHLIMKPYSQQELIAKIVEIIDPIQELK